MKLMQRTMRTPKLIGNKKERSMLDICGIPRIIFRASRGNVLIHLPESPSGYFPLGYVAADFASSSLMRLFMASASPLSSLISSSGFMAYGVPGFP